MYMRVHENIQLKQLTCELVFFGCIGQFIAGVPYVTDIAAMCRCEKLLQCIRKHSGVGRICLNMCIHYKCQRCTLCSLDPLWSSSRSMGYRSQPRKRARHMVHVSITLHHFYSKCVKFSLFLLNATRVDGTQTIQSEPRELCSLQ